MTDEQLCRRAQAGDERAVDELMRRYERIATGVASEFFLQGAERADVAQEARIGLLAAIRGYDPDRGARFNTFAYLAIRRQIITAVKTANRVKRGPLDDALRGGVDEDGEWCEILDLIPSRHGDPELQLAAKEELERVRAGIEALSPIERKWLLHVVNGGAYAFSKQADNAITRARLKLRAAA